MNNPVVAEQLKVQAQFADTIGDFDEAIEQFQTALEMMQECACKGSGSEGVEAIDSLFRSSMLLGDSSVGLDSASTELKNAGYSIENAARSMEAAAMYDAQMQKANKWMDLIQTGVSAYGSMSTKSTTEGTKSTKSTAEGTTKTTEQRAFGGPTKGGGLYQVAENGPEMYYEGRKSYLLAGNDGRVEPLRSGGGNTVNLTVNLPSTASNKTALQTANAVARTQRRAMRNI